MLCLRSDIKGLNVAQAEGVVVVLIFTAEPLKGLQKGHGPKKASWRGRLSQVTCPLNLDEVLGTKTRGSWSRRGDHSAPVHPVYTAARTPRA